MSKFKMHGFPSHHTGVQHKSQIKMEGSPVKNAGAGALNYGSQGASLGMSIGGPWGALAGAAIGGVYGYVEGDKAEKNLAIQNKKQEKAIENAAVANLYNTRKSGKNTEGSVDLASVKPQEVKNNTTKVESQPAKLEALYANPVAKKQSLQTLIEKDKKLKTIKK